MNEKEKGLFKKYNVTKLTNPNKEVDAIVLEFDDKLAHDAIWEWACTMWDNGYRQLYNDTATKLIENGGKYKTRRFVMKEKFIFKKDLSMSGHYAEYGDTCVITAKGKNSFLIYVNAYEKGKIEYKFEDIARFKEFRDSTELLKTTRSKWLKQQP